MAQSRTLPCLLRAIRTGYDEAHDPSRGGLRPARDGPGTVGGQARKGPRVGRVRVLSHRQDR